MFFKMIKIRRMSDAKLIEHINEDAEEGLFNTVYSREYDRRRETRNQGKAY
jgi:hypothetical protein